MKTTCLICRKEWEFNEGYPTDFNHCGKGDMVFDFPVQRACANCGYSEVAEANTPMPVKHVTCGSYLWKIWSLVQEIISERVEPPPVDAPPLSVPDDFKKAIEEAPEEDDKKAIKEAPKEDKLPRPYPTFNLMTVKELKQFAKDEALDVKISLKMRKKTVLLTVSEAYDRKLTEINND